MAPQRSYDDPDFDLNEELTQQRDERISPVVAVVGLIGVIVGLVVWGSLATSILSSGGSAANDVDSGSNSVPAAGDEEEDDNAGAEIDCDNLDEALSLSPAREAEYRDQCDTAEPEATAEPTPDTRTNREDCNTIRGTDYRSPEERQWFLANCVTR